MRVIKSLMVGLAFIAATAGASAATIDLGTLSDKTYGFSGYVKPGKSFTDYVNFSLSAPASLGGLVKSLNVSLGHFSLLGLKNFTVQLQSLVSGASLSTQVGSYSALSFADLAAGSYRLKLTGTGHALLGGYYKGAIQQVAAVPEPQTWLMLVVGFALIVFQLRRKQRSLPQQSLAAA